MTSASTECHGYSSIAFLSFMQTNQPHGQLKVYSQKPQQYLGQEVLFVNWMDIINIKS